MTVLEKLLDRHNVELVVTQPDKKRGRGGALVPSPVKIAAIRHGIPVTHELEDVKRLAPDPTRLGVVVAYGKIIPVDVLENIKMLNVHFSLLPRWRGAAPVERAIIAGDQRTGVCIMEVEPTLDTGGVYARCETDITSSDTAASLTDRLAHMGGDALLEVLSGELTSPVTQEGEVTYAHKIAAKERFIDWSGSSTDIWRRIRALSCFAIVNKKRIGLVEVEDLPDVVGEPAVVGPDAVVYAENGAVRLTRVQPEGKSVMSAADWLRGIRDNGGLRCDREQ